MKVVSVRTLDEALRALRGAGANARILAGGTDLMVEMEAGRTKPDFVVDVWRLDALRTMRETDAGLEIGALASCSDLLAAPAARRHADILVEAAQQVGAVQIRNRATIGGNLGTASPAADLNPALFALGARVRLASVRGAREIAVEQFVKGYRTTDRALDELIVGVTVPRRPLRERRAFRKVGTRRAQSISKVVVALALEFDGREVRRARIAAGSVADRTLAFDAFARELEGRPLPEGAALTALCRRHADMGCKPRDDVRSSARYRLFVLARLFESMLRALARPA